jgi:SecD/SecF fusion protein
MNALGFRGPLGAIVSCLLVGGCGSSVAPMQSEHAVLRDEGVIRLVYATRAGARPVTAASIEETIDIMRKRVDRLGVAHSEIKRSGPEEITAGLPNVINAQRAQQQVGKTAQLFFYDWELNVIGPSGNPDPTEVKVTGGANPASAEAGLPEYEAVTRALKRMAIIRPNDTTYESGCTPVQVGGCIYGSWYLLDETTRKALRGPEDTEKNLYGDNERLPANDRIKAVRINPGTVLVQARPITSKEGKVTQASPESWYVLNDDPFLSGKDINNPRQGLSKPQGVLGLLNKEERSGQREGTGPPDVEFGFSSLHSQVVFERLTREIAQRGQNAQLPGVPKATALQHFAVVLDTKSSQRPRSTTRSTRKGSTSPPVRRFPAASRSPLRRISPTSYSPERCRSSSN